MEQLNTLFSNIFLVFSRRNIYKYLIGRIDLTPDELDKIQEYIEKIRPLQFSEHKSDLIRQIEQRKIPYLRNLSVDELDYLLASSIDVNGLLAVIYAKGGMLSILGAIYWDKTNEKYNKPNTKLLIAYTLLILVLFNISIWMIFEVIRRAFSEIEIIQVIANGFNCIISSFSILLTIPLIIHMLGKKEMLEREYSLIFGCEHNKRNPDSH